MTDFKLKRKLESEDYEGVPEAGCGRVGVSLSVDNTGSPLKTSESQTRSQTEITTCVETTKSEKASVHVEQEDSVHSSNAWEDAELGDSGRKKKFLRLMGATKKEHHGRFVIGDAEKLHTKAGEESDKIEKNLENQYKSGLENKLSGAARHHQGLGYSYESTENTNFKPGHTDTTMTVTAVHEGERLSVPEDNSNVDGDSEKDSKSHTGLKMTGFVKANS